MEVVGAAASIISVAAAGLKIAQTLYEIADAVKSGGERLRVLSSHIENSAAVIEEVGNILRVEENAKNRVISQGAINSARNCTGRCSEIFSEFEEKINDARRNDLKTWFFPLREPQLRRLESELQTKKMDLNILLQCIIGARCWVTGLQSQEILQRMRIQEGIDARNALIKQAAAWQVEGEGMAERNPTTEVDVGPDIALPYPVHQHDRNPNSIGTEQDSELHMERPSKRDPPLSETEHFDINKVPADDSDFKSLFSSALFVVCCPCLALKPRSYKSDGKGRPSRAGNIPLQGKILQDTEYGGHLSPRPPRTPDGGARHDSDEKILPADRLLTTRYGSRVPERSGGVPEMHLISGRRPRADMASTWSEPSERLQTVDDLLRFWTTAYEDCDNEHVEKSTE